MTSHSIFESLLEFALAIYRAKLHAGIYATGEHCLRMCIGLLLWISPYCSTRYYDYINSVISWSIENVSLLLENSILPDKSDISVKRRIS